MTPTHLSMSHEGKETLRQIAEGLEGVTPGPWLEDGRYVFIDTRGPVCCGRGVDECCGNPDVEGDYYAIAGGGENNIPHIARCHPNAIRAIAAYVAAVEKERDELREFYEAREDISRVGLVHASEDQIDRVENARAAIIRFRAALKGDA